ncbi:unnamed protein product [Meloidogyne enterolobii]|uniref:Uncharacterized protein n=1 Tax=Meloidogyne enterolobii TaxID=390850 RepID=A0ACB1A5N1_MELEN
MSNKQIKSKKALQEITFIVFQNKSKFNLGMELFKCSGTRELSDEANLNMVFFLKGNSEPDRPPYFLLTFFLHKLPVFAISLYKIK